MGQTEFQAPTVSVFDAAIITAVFSVRRHLRHVDTRRGRCERHRDWFNLSTRDGADVRDIETIQPVNKRQGRCERHRDWFNLSIRDGADVRDRDYSTCK